RLAVRLEGALDRAALEGALNDLVDRHESLRTVFPERLGVPRQEILPAGAEDGAGHVRLQIETVDEAGRDGRSLEERSLEDRMSLALSRGFDLSREVPLRAHLYELGP